MEKNLVILLDLETTGLNTKKDRIVQLGCMLLRTKNRKNVYFNKTIYPHIPVSKYSRASQIHRISMAKLRNSESFPIVFIELIKWINIHIKSDCDEKIVILCAHNGFNFDFDMLLTEIIRYKVYFKLNFKCILCDTYPLFKKWFPNEKSYSLSKLYKNLRNKELSGAHDAIVDVNGLRKIICHYSKNMELLDNKYNVEIDILNFELNRNIDNEFKRINEEIKTKNIKLLENVYFIDSEFNERLIVKEDGGKWDDIQQCYYYLNDEIYKNARIKRLKL